MARKNFERDYTPWWQYDSDYYEPIFDAIEFIHTNQAWRRNNYLGFLRMYGDYKNAGLSASSYARQTSEGAVNPNNALSYNIVKANCDTATALVAKQNVKVSFLTQGGNWSAQQRAKMLEKFVGGLFYQTKTHPKRKKAFLHSTIFGTGATKIFREEDRIKVENILPHELYVDEAEALYGNPRQMFQIRSVSRSVLKHEFPEFADMIDEAELISRDREAYRHLADLVTVVEAWHLPSGKGATDGRRVMCISTGDLVVEDYSKNHFPFIFDRWGDRVLGFWGQGVAEILRGMQQELDMLLRTIQISMRLCSVPKVFVEIGSKVNYNQLNNDIGGIIFYTGTPPQYIPINSVPKELFDQVETLIRRSFELTGISTLTASAKKPSGLNSGVALREFKDIESERFAIVQQQYEDNYLTAAAYMLELAKEIHEEYGEFYVTSQDNQELKRINWKDVDLDKESYEMKLYPSSSLPSTPAGKLDKVIEYYQAGFFSREQAFSLLEFPDLEAATTRINADYDLTQKIIQYMVEDGKYMPPEPFMNLELGVREIQRAYLQAKMNNVPETRLELMRRWISQAQGLIEQFATPPPQPMPMEGAPMEGMPIAPPELMARSEMVPQVQPPIA